MINRRQILPNHRGRGATLALTPNLLRAGGPLGGQEVEFVIDQAGGVTKVVRARSQEVRGRRRPIP